MYIGMLIVHWTNLQINHVYYTKMLGPTFGVNNDVKKVKITHIQTLPIGEAMIYVVNEETQQILGFAVGGIFETNELGPNHQFWSNEEHSAAAAAG